MNNHFLATAVANLRPDAQWSLTGDDLSGLEWFDSPETRPADEDILAEASAVEVSERSIAYVSLRDEAYRAEADPLFFQEQRGEAPDGAWQAKVGEIKARYPKHA